MSPASKAAGSIFDHRWWVTIPHRCSQELKLPARVDGVARSNQASLLELRSELNISVLPGRGMGIEEEHHEIHQDAGLRQ